MKKRFLALGMAAVTAISSIITCTAGTADFVSISTGFSANSGDENVNGNFDITYTFHNATKDSSRQWNNFIVEVFDGKGQFLTLRADAWGWTAGNWTTEEGNEIVRFDTWSKSWDWASWVEDMRDADVTLNMKRKDNAFKVDYTIQGSSGTIYYVSADITLEGIIANNLMIHLTGEQVDLSNIKFIKNKDSETTGTDAEQTSTEPEQTPTDVIISDDNSISVEYGKEQFENKVNLIAKLLGENDENYQNIHLKDFVKDTENIPENIPFTAYNISLEDMNNQAVQPNGKVTVKIVCPEGYDDALSKVYRVNSNGSLTNMLAVLKDEYLTFETNHFSTYVITKEDLFAGAGFVYGDVNGDGEVDVKDAVLLKKYLAEFEDALNSLDKAAGDVTGDNEITSADAVRLLKALAEYDVELGR